MLLVGSIAVVDHRDRRIPIGRKAERHENVDIGIAVLPYRTLDISIRQPVVRFGSEDVRGEFHADAPRRSCAKVQQTAHQFEGIFGRHEVDRIHVNIARQQGPMEVVGQVGPGVEVQRIAIREEVDRERPHNFCGRHRHAAPGRVAPSSTRKSALTSTA